MTCERDVRRVYKGGVYHPTPSVFQSLDDEGIHVVDILRFYPYRATFDFECFFDGNELTNRHWSRAMGGSPHTAECDIEHTEMRIFFVKGSHRPRLLSRFEYAKWRGHGRRDHAPD